MRIRAALGLATAMITACAPARQPTTGTFTATPSEGSGTTTAGGMAVVLPAAETTPVDLPGDGADDPAIWIHPTDASASRIIGTGKDAGLYVFDLEGNVVQRVEGGRFNNVDVRYGFPLADRPIDIVAASEQVSEAIALYTVDSASGRLTDVSGPREFPFPSISGLCMYRSALTGLFYVFTTDADGRVRQWQLVEEAGRIASRPVRDITLESQAEGCVADDAMGALYVAEEDVGLWRYGAEPASGDERRLVARIDANPALAADFEGVAIYHGSDGGGYVIVSSQGNNSYAVFDRSAENAYFGSFVLSANEADGVDGTSDTDGIEVVSVALGPSLPAGLFVAQDGANESPPENQNFKLVRWEEIAEALGLESSSDWDPRAR